MKRCENVHGVIWLVAWFCLPGTLSPPGLKPWGSPHHWCLDSSPGKRSKASTWNHTAPS
uniref:Uncharacterized protein n=1 Tax=Poecilia reticulata TaxID=8081 RepID=A0A3P9N465_POERE